MQIRQDDLSGAKITDFLREHLKHMHEITPPESVYALGVDALRSPEVTFWSAWEDDELLGCGALKSLEKNRGEVKSMRTAPAQRGKGVASRLLEHLIKEATQRGYGALFLETGSMTEFAPARALYQKYGFTFCGPFGDYVDSPNNVFMTRFL